MIRPKSDSYKWMSSTGQCDRGRSFCLLQIAEEAKRVMQLCHRRRDRHQMGRDDFNTRWFFKPQLIIASLKIRAVINSRNWTSAHGFEQTHPISEQCHQETVPQTSEGNLESRKNPIGQTSSKQWEDRSFKLTSEKFQASAMRHLDELVSLGGVQAGLKLIGEEVIDETVSFHEALTLELGRNDLHVEVGLRRDPRAGATRRPPLKRFVLILFALDSTTVAPLEPIGKYENAEFADKNRDKYWRRYIANDDTLSKSITKLKVGRRRDAQHVFQNLLIKGYHLDVYTYTVMIIGLCKEGLLDDALTLISHMEDHACMLNAVTLEIIIHALFEKDETDKAE
ncbi:hypothetical protein V8G54_012261 [Vigna mungo]|uniref:Pentatricopeptide repeat-containing protein n=1 Tax=Vigna mungo TaxID=3915 RepID=A0AAQ3NST0_VIGMU